MMLYALRKSSAHAGIETTAKGIKEDEGRLHVPHFSLEHGDDEEIFLVSYS